MAQLRTWNPYETYDPFGGGFDMTYGMDDGGPYTPPSPTGPAPGTAASTPTAPGPASYTPPGQFTPDYNKLYADIENWYNTYLGRPGSYEEISGHTQNPYGRDAVQRLIQESPEARAYAAKQTATAPSTPSATPTGGTNTRAAMPIGFDAQKWGDPEHLTDKYVVGRMLASGATPDEVFAYLQPRGYERVGTDSVRDEHGDVYDFLFDEEGERRPQWTRVGGPGHDASPPGGGRPPAGRNPGLTAPGAGTFPNFQGVGGFGDMGELSKSITRGWQDYLSPERADARRAGALESARETMERGRNVQLRNMQATLADRGILSEPGIAQGPEISSLGRMEERIAPVYAQALREALADADQNTLTALQHAGSYQGMVTSLALQELGQSLDFQKFLANYGLDQARLQFEIENGNINNVLALFQLYLNAAKIAADGYV